MIQGGGSVQLESLSRKKLWKIEPVDKWEDIVERTE
jgi:hypothetical protein